MQCGFALICCEQGGAPEPDALIEHCLWVVARVSQQQPFDDFGAASGVDAHGHVVEPGEGRRAKAHLHGFLLIASAPVSLMFGFGHGVLVGIYT